MFTGIVVATGRIESVEGPRGERTLGVDAAALRQARLAVGDSLCVQGVCLTVVRLAPPIAYADVSQETLAKTTLGGLIKGANVNLEPSLRAGDAIGGHFVSGHVDGVGRVTERRPEGRSRRLQIEVPAALARFIAPKGSVAVDGVSLTVNEVAGRHFDVNIIPHTLQATTLGERVVGDDVNIEVDLLARYLERLLAKNPE